MKRELERYLQHCSNLHSILEHAKHQMFALQPHQLTPEEMGIFADVMLGLHNLQIEIQSAAFDMRHGQAEGEA